MKTYRRLLVVMTTGALAAASIAFFGVGPAAALPTGFAVVQGSVTESSTATTTTLTQTSDTAVIEFTTLQLNAGEVLDILQPDSSAILVILADSVGFTGTITAPGTVIIVSDTNFTVGSSAFIGVGADLILTTGAVDLADLGDGRVYIDPAAGDDGLSLILGAVFAVGGSIGAVASDISSGADFFSDTAVVVAATENATYEQGASPAVTTSGVGLGAVTLSGSITSPSVRVTTPDPATQTVWGVIRSTPGGVDGSASSHLGGNGASPTLDFASVVGGDGALASLGGYAATGPDAAEATYSTVSTSVDVVDGMPAVSTAILTDLELADSLYVSVIQTRCLTEDGLSSQLGIGLTEFDGVPFVPADYDFGVPNQPGIPVSDGVTVFFNVQEYSTVGGYEVLTSTALRLVGETESADFGVVSCAVPAAAVLASTGAPHSEALIAAGGAVALLGLGGIILGLRRRVPAA